MTPRLLIASLCGIVFGALLWVLPADQFALALLAAVSALAALQRPAFALVLFALAATFMPFATFQLGVRITVAEALLILAWAGTLWQLFIHRIAWSWGRTEKALVVLMLFSALPFVVGQVTIHADGSGAVNWFRWLLNLSVLLLVPLLLIEQRRREQLIEMLLLGTLAMLLLSLGTFMRHHNAMDMIPLLTAMHYAHPEAMQDIFSAEPARLGTPWVHPNLTGGALVLFLPLALFYGIARDGWRRWLGLTTAVLGVIGLLLSSSRGAILSLTLVLLWLVWLKVPMTRKLILAAFVAGAALVLFYPPLQARIATMFSSTNASTEIRFDEYRMFPAAMSRYPLGIGFKVDPPVPGSGLLGISNVWLNYIYKIGVPGMLLFCAVLWQWWRECRPRGKVPRVGADNAIWLGTLAGLSAALLTGLFDHYYSFTMVLVALFWLMMGLNLQAARALHPPRARRRGADTAYGITP